MGAQWGPCKLLAVPRGWSINDNVESDKVRLELWLEASAPRAQPGCLGRGVSHLGSGLPGVV